MPSVRSVAQRTRGEIDRWNPMFGKLLASFDGALALQLPDGSSSNFGKACDAAVEPGFALCLRDPQVLRSLLLGRNPLRFADAYFRGALDVDGDIFAALRLKDYLHSLRLTLPDRLRVALRLLGTASGLRAVPAQSDRLEANPVRSHSRHENRDAISFHYDLSNDFYALWLDESLAYSCAYFERPDMTLEQAQRAKLDHICRKLQLQAGEQFLDIGCGWGALILHAARHYGVRAHGITLSERQFSLARARIEAQGLGSLVTVELQDYRDLPGAARFDKVASVGMFEHVGLKNLPQYFDTVYRLLRPQGLFLNHGITTRWDQRPSPAPKSFVSRYVFPDGELQPVSTVLAAAEQAGFEVRDVEGLREHYARTLRHWVANLEREHDRVVRATDEVTYRIWRLYMSGSAHNFDAGRLGVFQTLLFKPCGGPACLPPTRADWYSTEPGAASAAH